MGVNHSYQLYFQRQDLWHAMDGLLKMAEPHQPPAVVHFPDHQKEVPLDPWPMRREVIRHDDPTFSFATVLKFDWDEAIEDWVSRHRYSGDSDRSPPDPFEAAQASVGYIYLNIYADLRERFDLGKPAGDLVLFEFDTTGTRMSTMFSQSTAMRAAFIHLLENYRGVSGMFYWESSSVNMFWLRGRHLSVYFEDLDQLWGNIGDVLNQAW